MLSAKVISPRERGGEAKIYHVCYHLTLLLSPSQSEISAKGVKAEGTRTLSQFRSRLAVNLSRIWRIISMA